MYQTKVYENIILTTFTNTITLEDLEKFAADINKIADTHDEIFMIALPINVKTHVSDLVKMRTTLSSMKNITGKATRLYGVRTNAILTFISKVTSSLLGTKPNMIESPNIDALFKTIEKEATLYPKLQESIVHLDDIKAEIEKVTAESASI